MGSDMRRKRIVPEYPTRLEAEAQPQRLLPGAPQRLVATIAKAGLAGGLLLIGIYGYQRASGADTEKLDREELFGEEKQIPPYAGSATVAPVFEHGDGRAATGCVVVAPPAFMTEEDARSVIREELEKLGIKLDQHDQVVKDIRIARKGFGTRPDPDNPNVIHAVADADLRSDPLNADFVDSERKIVVEFLSREDYHNLGGRMSMSTVQSYDFKTVAKKLAIQIEKQNLDPKRYFAVFYDPAAHAHWPEEPSLEGLSPTEQAKAVEKYQQDIKEFRERRKEDAAKEAAEQLRQQVRDFAKWLKDKGIL